MSDFHNILSDAGWELTAPNRGSVDLRWISPCRLVTLTLHPVLRDSFHFHLESMHKEQNGPRVVISRTTWKIDKVQECYESIIRVRERLNCDAT